MEARSADIERKRGCDPVLPCDPDTARPKPDARDSVLLSGPWRTTAPRCEKEKARTLLVRVTKMTAMRVAPVLRVELIHTPTLGRPGAACLNIPGNYI